MGFDCASIFEIETMLHLGVSAESIIFANTIKSPNAIRFALRNGVRKMTFDNLSEINKIAKIGKENKSLAKAELVLRIKVNDSNAELPLSSKFGVEMIQVRPLLMVIQ